MVTSVDFIGKEESAKIFYDEFGEDIVEVLGYNPLPTSLKVNLEENEFDSNQVNTLIEEYKLNLLIDEISYQGNYIDNIENIHSIAPAAPNKCPVIDFVELIGGTVLPLNILLTAATSTSSPAGVEVP